MRGRSSVTMSFHGAVPGTAFKERNLFTPQMQQPLIPLFYFQMHPMYQHPSIDIHALKKLPQVPHLSSQMGERKESGYSRKGHVVLALPLSC